MHPCDRQRMANIATAEALLGRDEYGGAYLRALFVPRQELALEAAALRQQFVVFKRKPLRPKLRRLDQLCCCSRRDLRSSQHL